MYRGGPIEPLDRRVWLSTPTMHGDELHYMQEAFETNWMSTVGANLTEIERQLTSSLGVSHAVALSSGTAALHLCFKLAGIKPGDKIFCNDLTFCASINPAVYEGATPIFIDTDEETLGMDPTALERAFELHPDTRYVVLVHLFGTPSRIDEIVDICNRHDAILIEDAAECLGASYKGAPVGTRGAYIALSFNGNKIITGSSGGMILTNNAEDAKRAKKWSTQSRDDAPWYQHTEIGYNYRMSNVVAGVVRGQIPYLENHVERKRAIYMRYKEAFEELPLKMNPHLEDIQDPSFWLSVMIIDETAMCDQTRTESTSTFIPESGKTCPTEICETLRASNIEARPIWKPMSQQPFFSDTELVTASNEADGSIPVSHDIFHRGLCLPSDINMSESDQDRIIELVKACFT